MLIVRQAADKYPDDEEAALAHVKEQVPIQFAFTSIIIAAIISWAVMQLLDYLRDRLTNEEIGDTELVFPDDAP